MKLCKNCLCPSHEAKDCKSASCKLCHQKHNTVLHPYVPTRVSTEPQPSTSCVINCNQRKTHSEVLLSTVIVNVRGHFGNLQPCRAFLDAPPAGSQSNFILESTCKRLGLSMKSINLSVTGFEQSISTIKNSVNVEMHSLAMSYRENLHCLQNNNTKHSLNFILQARHAHSKQYSFSRCFETHRSFDRRGNTLTGTKNDSL
jgi:hypothetical protein